jgi:hypothetical protein
MPADATGAPCGHPMALMRSCPYCGAPTGWPAVGALAVSFGWEGPARGPVEAAIAGERVAFQRAVEAAHAETARAICGDGAGA